MEESRKYYGGLIFIFILILLFFINFIRKTDFDDPESFMDSFLPSFFIYGLGLLACISFIHFYDSKSKNSTLILTSTLSALIVLTFITLGVKNVGEKNNTSLLMSLFYFILLFGVVGFWKKLTEAEDSTSSSTSSTNSVPLLDPSQLKYISLFLAYIITVLVLYLYNPGGIMTKYGGASIFLSIFISLIFIGIIFGYSLFDKLDTVGPKTALLMKGSYILLSLFVSCLLIWWILDSIGVFSNNADNNVGSILFNLLILIGALTIVFKFSYLGGWLSQNSFWRLLVNSFLYIPCLFSGLIDKIRGLKPTSSPTNPFAGTQMSDVVALLVVLSLIVVYFIITRWIYPGLKNWYFLKGGKQLVAEPVSINQRHNLDSFVELNEVPEDETSLSPSYRYGISFWLYMDSFPPSTSSAYSKYSTILDYGGVPLVKYYAATNTLGVFIKNRSQTDKDDKKEERMLYSRDNIPLQKWNNLVINYLNGTMDIFYNGELVSSSIEVSPPIIYDGLTVGMEGGINGNIANVVYYKDPLSINSINNLYTSLKKTSPPIG